MDETRSETPAPLDSRRTQRWHKTVERIAEKLARQIGGTQLYDLDRLKSLEKEIATAVKDLMPEMARIVPQHPNVIAEMILKAMNDTLLAAWQRMGDLAEQQKEDG